MAAATPIASTELGGLSRVLQHDREALLSPIALGVNRSCLLVQPRLAAGLTAARSMVAGRYRAERCAQMMADLHGDVVGLAP